MQTRLALIIQQSNDFPSQQIENHQFNFARLG